MKILTRKQTPNHIIKHASITPKSHKKIFKPARKFQIGACFPPSVSLKIAFFLQTCRTSGKIPPKKARTAAFSGQKRQKNCENLRPDAKIPTSGIPYKTKIPQERPENGHPAGLPSKRLQRLTSFSLSGYGHPRQLPAWNYPKAG